MRPSVQWCLIICNVLTASADVYLHSPRGSNNRVNGVNRDRDNANRMFDSQNNDRGGYNAGGLYYFTNSKLAIEWTNQHSCGDENNNCEIIIQYMCSDTLRDGTREDTIPEVSTQCQDGNCDKDLSYGMHEDYEYYASCKLRSRNKGLFTSDRNLQGESAKYTRQNEQGTRHGYECPEERDYYPYWHPTPWKDIAVLTNDVSRCNYYKSQSQNVKSRFYCSVPTEYLLNNANNKVKEFIPIEKEKCEEFLIDGYAWGRKGVWKEYGSHGLPPPECMESLPSRDNHLGNTIGGYAPTFNWTVFDNPNKRCAMRIRYNISTAEFEWNTDAALNNANLNPSTGPDIWTDVGFTEEEAIAREYYLHNNPQVNVFDTTMIDLQLAINTAQYGRTFEDRSHRFIIQDREISLTSGGITNVNVVGKRGNIVQVYPSVEYDYVPRVTRVTSGDYVHFQWTGSDDNPQDNDGQGRAGTDRSNIVPMRTRSFPEGDRNKAAKYTHGQAGVSYPRNVFEANFLGFTNATKMNLATMYNANFGGASEELDDAGTYYDIGPQKVTTTTGDYNFICTRNNNFSNRSQKGKIVVREGQITQQYMGELGGTLTVKMTDDMKETTVEVLANSLPSPQMVVLEIVPEDELTSTSRPTNQDYISHFVHISNDLLTTSNYPMAVTIGLTNGVNIDSFHRANVYNRKADGSWTSLSIDNIDSDSVTFHTNYGGQFVVVEESNPGPLAGLIVGLILAVALTVVAIFYLRSSKLSCVACRDKI